MKNKKITIKDPTGLIKNPDKLIQLINNNIDKSANITINISINNRNSRKEWKWNGAEIRVREALGPGPFDYWVTYVSNYTGVQVDEPITKKHIDRLRKEGCKVIIRSLYW